MQQASAKQVAFIKTLAEERDLDQSAQDWIADKLANGIGVGTASKVIEKLLAMPKRASENLTPGVFETPAGIFIVKLTRDKQRTYAKRLVEIGGERLTEAGTVVPIEFEYDAGAIRSIREEHRMPLDKAKELTIRYGRCIVCGRHLKAAQSVERGIGPVCIKSFA